MLKYALLETNRFPFIFERIKTFIKDINQYNESQVDPQKSSTSIIVHASKRLKGHSNINDKTFQIDRLLSENFNLFSGFTFHYT